MDEFTRISKLTVPTTIETSERKFIEICSVVSVESKNLPIDTVLLTYLSFSSRYHWSPSPGKVAALAIIIYQRRRFLPPSRNGIN